VQVGERVPDLTLHTIDGQTLNLRETVAARPTVMVFVSPWCESYLAESRAAIAASCRAAREQVTRLAAITPVRWLGIASGLWENEEDLKAYGRTNKMPLPLALDASGRLFRTFRVNSVPTVLLVDAKGILVRQIEGGEVDDPSVLIGALRALVDDKRSLSSAER
jgi:peroxiredoxin